MCGCRTLGESNHDEEEQGLHGYWGPRTKDERRTNGGLDNSSTIFKISIMGTKRRPLSELREQGHVEGSRLSPALPLVLAGCLLIVSSVAALMKYAPNGMFGQQETPQSPKAKAPLDPSAISPAGSHADTPANTETLPLNLRAEEANFNITDNTPTADVQLRFGESIESSAPGHE
jgi:hypothetical protein